MPGCGDRACDGVWTLSGMLAAQCFLSEMETVSGRQIGAGWQSHILTEDSVKALSCNGEDRFGVQKHGGRGSSERWVML